MMTARSSSGLRACARARKVCFKSTKQPGYLLISTVTVYLLSCSKTKAIRSHQHSDPHLPKRKKKNKNIVYPLRRQEDENRLKQRLHPAHAQPRPSSLVL